jgi:hypothetical protein
MDKRIKIILYLFIVYYLTTSIFEILAYFSIYYPENLIGVISNHIYYTINVEYYYAPVYAFIVDPFILLTVLVLWFFFQKKTGLKIGRIFSILFLISFFKWCNLLIGMLAVAG